MDYIVRLLGESQGLTTAADTGRSSVWQLNKGMDSLIATMEREQNSSRASARELQVLALADKGAAASKVEYALSLAKQLDSQEQFNATLAETEAVERRNQEAIDRTIASLKRQSFELAHGADQMTIFDLKTRGASDAEINLASRLLASAAASRDKARADTEAARTADRKAAAIKANETALRAEFAAMALSAGIDIQTNNGGRRLDTRSLGPVSKNYQQLNAFSSGLPNNPEMADMVSQLQQRSFHEERVARGIERRNQAQQRMNRTDAGGAGAARTNMMAIQALAFGVQDAAQVYGTTGLAGAISASANNLIFMTSLLSPQLAIFTAIAVAGGQFAAVLLPMAFNSKKLAEEGERLTKVYATQIDVMRDLARERREYAHTVEDATGRDQAKGVVKKTAREGQDIAAQIAEQEQAIARLQARRKAAEEKEMWARQKQSLLGRGMEAVGASGVEGVAEQKAIDKEIAEERKKLAELRNDQRENNAQQGTAGQNFAAADAEHRQEEARKYRLEQDKEKTKESIEYTRKKNEEAEKEHARFVKDRQALQKTATDELIDDERKKRYEALQSLGEQQAQINRWLLEDRISADEAVRLKQLASAAAVKKIEDDERKKKIDPLKEAIDKQKKITEDQMKDPSGQALAAVEANSSQGIKQIFDALGGGSNPQIDIAKNTAAMHIVLKSSLEIAGKQLEALEKNKPIKTGGT